MAESLDVRVISLGGSIIVPEGIDSPFLRKLSTALSRYLQRRKSRRIILVCGGGTPAREYQKAYREVVSDPEEDDQDWIGIAATRLNAELLKRIFSAYCPLPIVTDPTDVSVFAGRILIAGGWKPGFSTDYDAVILAERFSSDTVINLSDIPKVYSEDPDVNPRAIPLDRLSWAEFREMVGGEWRPGANAPFDPIAAGLAAEKKISVIVADGRNLDNLGEILEGRSFVGTVIGPE